MTSSQPIISPSYSLHPSGYGCALMSPRPGSNVLWGVKHRKADASTNEVSVSINIIHAVDRRPVFIDPEGAGRKAGGLARIGPVPFADEVFDGVRRVLQRIVLFVHAPLRDGPRLLANGEHRVTETVEFPLRLRLGGLPHQRPCDGPAHGRRVEAAIDEPLRDVVDGDASLLE